MLPNSRRGSQVYCSVGRKVPDVAQALMPAAPRLVSALRLNSENLPTHNPLTHMRPFRRGLPHQHPEGKWLFVAWHLHGSLPHASYPPPVKPSWGSAFVWMDRYLDSARSGPVYLAREPIARIVEASLRRGVLLGQYALGAYAIMANDRRFTGGILRDRWFADASSEKRRVLKRPEGSILISHGFRLLN